ncbi:Hypothetical Protein FCC1311_108522 [Hondaea fermentalgiana]|uniref:Transmembrane protein n=1 Tax=Hondaea fermentalgiana TaxID=2315210 RepID=A0A2R5GUV3_9STRA|nr:Hypothetical Protein FCC1311_108522 [Hondaea fermentalgiana]|eukprot:GBG34630.1 Hypothetical Protein FCC1311_108522 [Hondaea fermentalgiana]
MGASWVDAVLGALGSAVLGLVGFLALCLVVGVLREARTTVADSRWFKKAFSRLEGARSRQGAATLRGETESGEHARGPSTHNLKEKIQKVMKGSKNPNQTKKAATLHQDLHVHTATQAAQYQQQDHNHQKDAIQNPQHQVNGGRRGALSSYNSSTSSRPASAASRRALQPPSQDAVPFQPESDASSLLERASTPPQASMSSSAAATSSSGLNLSARRNVAAATAAKRRLFGNQGGVSVTGPRGSTPTASDVMGPPLHPQSADAKSSRRRPPPTGLGSAGGSERQRFKERARAVSSKFKRAPRPPRQSWSAFVQRQATNGNSSDEDDDDLTHDCSQLHARQGDTDDEGDVTQHGSAGTISTPSLTRDVEVHGCQTCDIEADSPNTEAGRLQESAFVYFAKSTLVAVLLGVMALCLLLSLLCLDADNEVEAEAAATHTLAETGTFEAMRACMAKTQKARFSSAQNECAAFSSLAAFRQGTRSISFLGCVCEQIVWPWAPSLVKGPVDAFLASLKASSSVQSAGLAALSVALGVVKVLAMLKDLLIKFCMHVASSATHHMLTKSHQGETFVAEGEGGGGEAPQEGVGRLFFSGGIFMTVAVAIVAASRLSYKEIVACMGINVSKKSDDKADAERETIVPHDSPPSAQANDRGSDKGATSDFGDLNGRKDEDYAAAVFSDAHGNTKVNLADDGIVAGGGDFNQASDESLDHGPDSHDSVSWDNLSRTVSRDLYVASAYAGTGNGSQGRKFRLGRTESSPEPQSALQRSRDRFPFMGHSQPDIQLLASSYSNASAPVISGKLQGLSAGGSETSQETSLDPPSLESKRLEAERFRIERLHERLQQSMDRISRSLHVPRDDESLSTVRESFKSVESSLCYRRGLRS